MVDTQTDTLCMHGCIVMHRYIDIYIYNVNCKINKALAHQILMEEGGRGDGGHPVYQRISQLFASITSHQKRQARTASIMSLLHMCLPIYSLAYIETLYVDHETSTATNQPTRQPTNQPTDRPTNQQLIPPSRLTLCVASNMLGIFARPISKR